MNRRTLLKVSFAIGSGILFAPPGRAASVGLLRAPAFDVVDSSGNRRDLTQFTGKTVVLEWTSPSCPFVAAQYKSGNMQELQKWATERGVIWLSVLSTHPSRGDYLAPDRAGSFISTHKAVPTALLVDSTGTMGRAYGARTTPHMFVIDPTGVVVYEGAIDSRPTVDAKVVPGSVNFVRAALTDLAAGRPVAEPKTRPYGCSVGYG